MTDFTVIYRRNRTCTKAPHAPNDFGLPEYKDTRTCETLDARGPILTFQVTMSVKKLCAQDTKNAVFLAQSPAFQLTTFQDLRTALNPRALERTNSCCARWGGSLKQKGGRVSQDREFLEIEMTTKGPRFF